MLALSVNKFKAQQIYNQKKISLEYLCSFFKFTQKNLKKIKFLMIKFVIKKILIFNTIFILLLF